MQSKMTPRCLSAEAISVLNLFHCSDCQPTIVTLRLFLNFELPCCEEFHLLSVAHVFVALCNAKHLLYHFWKLKLTLILLTEDLWVSAVPSSFYKNSGKSWGERDWNIKLWDSLSWLNGSSKERSHAIWDLAGSLLLFLNTMKVADP